MEKNEIDDFSELIMSFFIKGSIWCMNYINTMFDKNGKGDNELTMRRDLILTFIENFGYGSVSMFEKHMHLSKSSISLTLNKMVKSGYLYKSSPENDEDKRKIHFYITDKGREAIKNSRAMIKSNIVNLLSKYDDEQFTEIRKAITILDNALEAYDRGKKA